MKKILLIGEIYSSNLGDGLLCEVVIDQFCKEFELFLCDLSGETNYKNYQTDEISFNLKEQKRIYYKKLIKKTLNKFSINISSKNFKEIVKKSHLYFDKCINTFQPDCILFAGGQMFNACFIKQISYIISYADYAKIPVYFNACGLGNDLSRSNLKKIKKIISNKSVKYITLRDGINNFKDLSKINSTFDTALLSNRKYQRALETPIVGIGVMISPNHNIKKQIEFWKKIIEYCENEQWEWQMFCNGNIDDEAFIKYLLSISNKDIKKHYAKRPNTPEELIETITKYKGVISMRLHSLLIACSYNIPNVAISWDNKINEFYKKINAEEDCFDFETNHKEILKRFYTKQLNRQETIVQEKLENIIISNINNIKRMIK